MTLSEKYELEEDNIQILIATNKYINIATLIKFPQ